MGLQPSLQVLCIPTVPHEEFCLLGYDTMYADRSLLTFWTNAAFIFKVKAFPYNLSSPNTYNKSFKQLLITARPRMWSSSQEFLATDSDVPGSIPTTARFFLEVVGLERGPLSLVSTTEELLGRNSSGFGLENREYSCMELLH
jgi:hypothetical protein